MFNITKKAKQKTKKKKIINFFLTFTLIFSQTLPALASAPQPTFNDHVLAFGLDGAEYFVHSSASDYNSKIKSAVKSWKKVCPLVTLSKYSKIRGTQIRIKAVRATDYPQSTAFAWTTMWLDDERISAYNDDWDYAEITLNDYKMEDYEDQPSIQQAAIAHELGHAMGLAENNSNPYSIMCQKGSGRKVNVPQSCDGKTIKYLYDE